MNPRERFLAAARCQPTDRPPVWLMRQAGRYLPEYRALKKKHDFLELVQTPGLAAEVTLQPLRRFELDAAIVFSDILVIPEALGQGYHFREQGGIGMNFALDRLERIDELDGQGIEQKLGYVAETLRHVRTEIGDSTALLGFSGSPWTLACYMVEGGSSKDFSAVKRLAWEQPEAFEKLLQLITDATVGYLRMQIEAGADAVQIFDSWAAACPAHHYEAWSLRWIRHIVKALGNKVPVILFARGMGHLGAELCETGANVLGLDWTLDMRLARRQLGHGVAVQGNLDPVILTTTPELTRRETLRLLEAADTHPGFIFNLGHGMLPTARLECVQSLLDTVLTWHR